MSYVTELHDRLNRAARIKKWTGWFKKLKKIKDKSRASWCEDNGFDTTQLGHAMAGRRCLTWETINAVEAAMEKENMAVEKPVKKVRKNPVMKCAQHAHR